MASNRFFVNEDQWGRFNVTDTATGDTTAVHYNYVGNSGTAATTWDFAPLDEQREVDAQGYLQFRNRMHGGDEQFIARQMLWNGRLEQFNNKTITATTGTFTDTTIRGSCLTTTTWASTDITGSFWLTSDVGRYSRGIPWLARHCPRLAGFEEQIKQPFNKLAKLLHLNESGEMIAKRKKEEKGMQLLKSWLDEHEFNEIMKRGELEIFAEDAVYIVKRDSHATVLKKEKNGKKTEFCLITKELGYATGDILLAKILMLKTNPKNFEKQANGHILTS